MNSSKQLNTIAWNKQRHFVFADVADVSRFCNHYQLQTSLIAESMVRIAYNFWCTLQNKPVLIYFAHFVLL